MGRLDNKGGAGHWRRAAGPLTPSALAEEGADIIAIDICADVDTTEPRCHR